MVQRKRIITWTPAHLDTWTPAHVVTLHMWTCGTRTELFGSECDRFERIEAVVDQTYDRVVSKGS